MPAEVGQLGISSRRDDCWSGLDYQAIFDYANFTETGDHLVPTAEAESPLRPCRYIARGWNLESGLCFPSKVAFSYWK